RSWVFTARSSVEVPDLAEPLLVIASWNEAHLSLLHGWFPVGSRLSLDQNELDIVLDDRVRLVGFSENGRIGVRFVLGACNLVPEYRCQIIKSGLARPEGYVRVKGIDNMTTKCPPGYAHVANNANETSAGDKHSVGFGHNLREFIQELAVVSYYPQLPINRVIFLQDPVG